MSGPVIVAEFETGGLPLDQLPSGIGLVRAAALADARRVVLDVHATTDGWAVVHPGTRMALAGGEEKDVDDLELAETRGVLLAKGEVCTVEQVLLEAHRCKLGIVFRLSDTLAIPPLAAGLGVTGGQGRAQLARRFLVVVPDQRLGRRLRTDAKELPSALEIRAGEHGMKARLRRRFPNLSRAGADCDHLLIEDGVVPHTVLTGRLLRKVRSRGGELWVGGLTLERAHELREHPFGGLIVRLPLPG